MTDVMCRRSAFVFETTGAIALFWMTLCSLLQLASVAMGDYTAEGVQYREHGRGITEDTGVLVVTGCLFSYGISASIVAKLVQRSNRYKQGLVSRPPLFGAPDLSLRPPCIPYTDCLPRPHVSTITHRLIHVFTCIRFVYCHITEVADMAPPRGPSCVGSTDYKPPLLWIAPKPPDLNTRSLAICAPLRRKQLVTVPAPSMELVRSSGEIIQAFRPWSLGGPLV